jgi:hypothetical protein
VMSSLPPRLKNEDGMCGKNCVTENILLFLSFLTKHYEYLEDIVMAFKPPFFYLSCDPYTTSIVHFG